MYKVIKIRANLYQVINSVTGEIFGGYKRAEFAASVAALKNTQSKV